MNERRFNAQIERLRSPERLARMEVQRVVDLCLESINASSMLDVGTGSGVFAEAFSKRGLGVTGIDINPEMVKAAAEFAPTAVFRVAPMESIPFEEKTFDIVFLGHVLHEADDLPRALSEAKRTAKFRVAVLEWPYKEEEIGPPIDHRLKTESVVSLAKAAGFNQIETLPLSHMVLFLLTIQRPPVP
jgi:ubiquinone/menaquinone biosynthesis C-methylase UbiE